MKVVIEIDEARFKDIRRIAEVQLERNHFQAAEQIIAKGVPIEQGSDLISRQAAIDEIRWEEEYGRIDTRKAIEVLKRLPSVEPERKTGKWIWDMHYGKYKCSECGCNPCYENDTDVYVINKYRYCRWCGSEMEGSE